MTTGHRLAEGTTLGGGRYVVDAVLGQGGFGVTYRATDTQLHRPVAVKEFFLAGSTRADGLVRPPPGLEGEFTDRLERIRDEARALARFRHPSIVTVHEFLEENGTIYVVMELLRGRTLKQVMAGSGGPLPEDQAVRYSVEIAAALDAIHAEHLLHRDVKPDNVMVMEDGHVALVDFGTAREFSAGQSSLMSQTLTPGYAPVEQYTAHGRFGPATDVYALGATAYHMLTGVPPVPSLDRYTGAAELPGPKAINPAISQAASDAVVWAMALSSNERPQSAGEFAAALRGAAPAAFATRQQPSGGTTRVVDPTPALTTPPPPVRETTPPPPLREPRPPVRRRRRGRAVRRGARKVGRVIINLIITIAIGIGATFAVTWFLQRDDNGPPPTPAPVVEDPNAQVDAPPPAPDNQGEERPTRQEETPETPPAPEAVMLLDVVDVAGDDTLNVREGPGVDFDPPIAELAPDAVDVAATGNVANIGRSYWAELALGGGVEGWASLNFLDADGLGEELALTESLRVTLAGVLLSEPGVWVVTAEVDARRGPGDRFEPVVALAAGSVVNGTGDAALVDGAVWAQVVGEGLPPVWLPGDVLDVTSAPDFLGQPPGLLCADLAAQGFDYAAVHAYWEWDGGPDRMDADTNGVPCETVYPPQEVVFFQSLRG